MIARRLPNDESGRVPFAMVAVLILMLSLFSSAYLAGIQRQEAGQMLIKVEVGRQTAVMHRVEEAMSIEAYYQATRAIAVSTRFLCDPTMLDLTFQENYSDYLNTRFPMYSDPYNVEVSDFTAMVLLEESNLHDIVESNETVDSEVRVKDQDGSVGTHDVEILDTAIGGKYDETSALARYVVAGHGNCTVRNTRSGAVMRRPISFEETIDSPFPLMNSKVLALEGEGTGNAMGLARITKYILTTLAQFRVLEGYGSGLDGVPGGTDEIITQTDVELAINLAILFETARLFRSFDPDLLDALETGGSGPTLGSLVGQYLNTGTVDPADIVALYLELDQQVLPIDIMIGQAFNAIVDQFVLKYLDYFGITDIANFVYKSCQELAKWIEDAGKSLSAFIFGDDGEDRKEAEQVTGWLNKQMTEASRKSNSDHWPPDGANVTDPRLRLGGEWTAPTDLGIFDVVEPIDQRFTYFANCSRLLQEREIEIMDHDSQVIGIRYELDLQMYNISTQTMRSIETRYPDGYIADFQPTSMLRQSSELQDLWVTFYNDHYADSEDVIYDTIRDAVKNVSVELASVVTMFIQERELSLAAYDGGAHSIDPEDKTSTLESVKEIVDDVITDTVEHLQQHPESLNIMLSALAYSQSQLTLRFIEFLDLNYDTIVNRTGFVEQASGSLGECILDNATMAVVTGNTTTANYSVYNDLGHQRGYVDDSPVVYDCTVEPGNELAVQLISQQNRAQMTADLQPYAEHAYTVLKDSEAKLDYYGSPDNGMVIKALESTISGKQSMVVSLFIGAGQEFGLVTMAGDFVKRILSGIIWGGDVANTMFLPTIMYSGDSGPVPFDLYEGEHGSAVREGRVRNESFEVRMPDGMLAALPLEPHMTSSDDVPIGHVAVGISEPRGRHYTDITTFSDRPFETSWNLTIRGKFDISVNGSTRVLLGEGTHEPPVANGTVKLDLDIPIVVYSGWDLVGVVYESTSTLAGDIGALLDLIADFFGWVWDTIAGPINWIIDQIMKVVDFFSDIIGTLLSYASEVVNIVTDMIGFLVELLQDFMRTMANLVLNSIVEWIIDMMPNGANFQFSMFGFTFLLTFAPNSAIQEAEDGGNAVIMSIRTMGELFGVDFDVGLELCALSDDLAKEIGSDYDLLLWSVIDIFGFTLDTRIDPFMATSDHMVECHGEGSGWGLDLVIPEVEVYDSIQYSLQDIPGIGTLLSNIPIPFLGLEASVDAGLNIKYTLRGVEEDNVVINEVELNPRGWDAGNQWIELYNPTNVAVDIVGWTLGSPTDPGANTTFSTSTIIDPGGYLIIDFENTTLPTSNMLFQLLDPYGQVVDSTPLLSEAEGTVVQGTYVDVMGSRKTWQRTPNGADLAIGGEWTFTNSSFGSENAGMDIEFKEIVWTLLKNAFVNTWESLKDTASMSLDFIVKLVTEFIKRFIDDVLTVIERTVIETALFVDVQLREVSGTAGGGITLSFVIEGGGTLRALLSWVIDSISAFMSKFGKATQPSKYPSLSKDVPEHLFIRLDFYAVVNVPEMIKNAVGHAGDLETIKLGGRIEANIPALAALVGKDMGRWRINFGVYIESLPAAVADPLFGTGEGVNPDVWLFKGVVYEN